MFPFQPNCEIGFGTPITSQEYQIPNDLITDLAYSTDQNNLICFTDHAFTANNQISFSTTSNDVETTGYASSERRRSDNGKDCSIRKAMHRESERKRRQEMSQLSASLSSLLPLEKTRVKRAVPDQMEEAANHIKEMEKKIQRLRNRRDKLNRSRRSSCSSSNGSDERVTVKLVSDGIEVLISCSNEMSDLGLSQFLAALEQTELDVVSCISTTTKEGVFHKIKIEAPDVANVDVSELQNRLSNVMN